VNEQVCSGGSSGSPGVQECKTTYEQQCSTQMTTEMETTYKEECSNVPEQVGHKRRIQQLIKHCKAYFLSRRDF
jgi:hypothetical protein